MFIQYFYLLCLTCLVFLIIELIGKLVASTIRNYQESIFINSIIGFFLIIFFVSIIHTKGKTVFILPFVLSLGLLFVNRRQLSFTFSLSFDWRKYIYVFVILLIPFTLYFFHSYDFKHQQLILTSCDDIFYGRMSQILINTGIEANRGLNNFFPMIGCTPWHYGEMWFSGYFAKLFNINVVVFYTICTYSIGNVMIVLGFNELFFGKKFKIINLLACFFLTTIIGVNLVEMTFGRYLMFIENMTVWSSDAFTISKLFLIYNLFILIIILYKKNTIKLIPYIFFLSAICFFTLVPGVFLLSIFMIGYLYLKEKRIDKDYLIVIFLFFILLLFYSIWGNKNLNSDVNIVTLLKSNLFESIKGMIICTISHSLELLLTYIFYIPLVVFFLFLIRNQIKLNNKNIQHLLIVFIVIAFTSVISGIMFYQFDAWQILSNFSVPIINIFLAFVLIYLWTYKYLDIVLKNFIKFIIICIFLITYYYRDYWQYLGYSEKLLGETKIQNELLEDGLKLYWGDFWSPDSTYRTSVICNGVQSPISYIASINDKVWTINVKYLYKVKNWKNLYPFENININDRIKMIEYISNFSNGILICDKGSINDIPIELRKKFKIIEL